MVQVRLPAGRQDARADLTAVDYGYDASDAIRLERKDDMRKRGLASPDDGDALALTFAYPVERRNWEDERRIQEKLALRKRCYLESCSSGPPRFQRRALQIVSRLEAGGPGDHERHSRRLPPEWRAPGKDQPPYR